MELLLEVRSVYAGYIPDLYILQGINFKLYENELITIIGPNGSGKSTFVKTIFGLLHPQEGKIFFKGEDISQLKPDEIVQRGLCYVPQVSNVFASLSIEENLEMGAYLKQGSIDSLKEQMYTMFPILKQRRKQQAGTLSGGERQMLAMARALMLDPEVLLLDEPSAALSPILVTSVFEQIKAINEAGKSIILVEQNAKKALMMAHRGYVLESGKDRFEGKGEDLLNDPKVGELYLGITH